MLKRYQNWVILLNEFIESHRHMEFIRGVNDCAIFTADAVKVMTGVDLAEDFRGSYKNKTDAKKALTEKGYKNLEKVATDRLGAPYETPLKAQRGDVVLIQSEKEIILGVVDLTGARAISTGKDGITYFKMKDWLKAWKV